MLKSKGIINHTLNEFRISRKYSNNYVNGAFKLQRALIVTKFSRYEFEQMRHANLNKDQLETMIRNRGTDYDSLLHTHYVHKEFEKKIANSFQDLGCEVKITNRNEFRQTLNKDIIKWADILVPVGGDGTFLLAAGRASPMFAHNQQKIPIVGFNSDPQRSEGRLMLPKYYSEHPKDAIAKIKAGEFNWLHRSRIRTSLLMNNGHMPRACDLHRHYISKIEQEQPIIVNLNEELSRKYKAKIMRVLPYLALNEVFIGETVSARVSHLQIVVDHSDVLNRTKCSGLCVTTGSGSTSWHTSINRMSKQSVEDLVKILPQSNILKDFSSQEISDMYNRNLLFAPDDPRLCYSVREQISVGVWPKPKDFPNRNFINSIFVRSKCIDACLVIDGSISFPFNDGAKVLLECHPEDALLAINLD